MRIKRHSRFYSYLVILLICVSNLSFAKSKRQIGNVLIILPNSAMPYQIIVTNIRRELRLKHRGERVNVLNLSAKSFSGTILKGNRLVVTLGAKSLDFYLKSGINTQFISSFITEDAFAKLAIDNPQKKLIARRYVGGISLEQPVYRLVSLAKKLQGNTKSIGVVLGPNSNKKFPALRRQIQRQLGSVLNVANIRRNDNPVKNFDDALNSDTDRFALFHQKMLENGVYFACSQFETGFICAAMDDAMIDDVIEISKKVFSEIA